MQKRSCVLCGAAQADDLFRPKRSPGPIVRCAQCGLVYVGEIQDGSGLVMDGPVLSGVSPELLHSANLADLAGTWELARLQVDAPKHEGLRLNAWAALARLARHIRPPGRLLDFGCGPGVFLGVARDAGWEPYGLEPLPGHAVYARATSGAAVVTDILRDDSFPPDYFTAITSFQVFEHLPDPAGDLARLCRMARPGAALLIEVPNIDTFAARLLRSRHRHFNPDHLTFFSPRTLSAFMEKCGLQVVDAYYPTRNLTAGHLSSYWAQRYLPRPAAQWLRRTVAAHQWQSRTLRANLHDIVAVIARKP